VGSFLVSGTIFFAFVENRSVLDAFYFSATTLPPVGLGTPDSPQPDPLAWAIMLVFLAVLLLLAFVAAVLAVIYLIYYLIYLIRWLLSEAGRVALRSSLNRLRTVLTANSNGLLMAWIGVGVLFFLMVVVPGALLIYQYSSIGD
jgi:hypothetical protein